jgi:HSP20 family protein
MSLIKHNSGEWEVGSVFGKDLREEANRLFGHKFLKKNGWLEGFHPAVEMHEEPDKYVFKADIPGVKKEEIDVKVEGNRITIKGERKQEKESKEKDYHVMERSYGSFLRTFQVPSEIKAGGVKAACKDGVLELIVPKAENTKSKQVRVDVK